MYANFTEETATGTGDVLTLTGATTGNIPFSASFTNGDLVAYVVEDSAGVKVAGIGTYSAGTITRNDTWNYNGSVVDKNPATNIALNGTNTVRCDVTSRALNVEVGEPKLNTIISGSLTNAGDFAYTLQPDKIYYIPFLNNTGAPINATDLSICVRTAGSSTARVIVGFATANNGDPSKILFQTGEIDVSTTGFKAASCSGFIPVGWSLAVATASESVQITATSRTFLTANPVLSSARTGNSMYSRNFARADRLFSELSDPLPASTAQFDLDNVPLIGVGI